tara:strand:- start:14497 stop:14715 length:219 start_codon:yes stop_codon:yes gene_type:complete
MDTSAPDLPHAHDRVVILRVPGGVYFYDSTVAIVAQLKAFAGVQGFASFIYPHVVSFRFEKEGASRSPRPQK